MDRDFSASLYEDAFLRELARRLKFLMSLPEGLGDRDRFLDDLRRALERTSQGRAGVPAH